MTPISKPNKFSWILTALLSVIPFIQFSSLADPTLLSRQVLTLIFCAIAWSILLAGNRKTGSTMPAYFMAAMVVLLGAYFFSLLVAKNQPESYYTLSKIAWLLSGIWILQELIRNGNLSLKQIGWGIFLASAMAITLLVMEWYFKSGTGNRLMEQKNLYQLQTAFGHKNLYASFQLLCLPFLFLLLLNQKGLLRWLISLVILIILLSLVMVQTKSVLLGLGVGVVLIWIPAVFLLPFSRTKKSFLAAMPLLGLLILLVLIFQFPERFSLILNNDTVKERWLLWKNTWAMIQEHFWTGVGAGNWQVYFPKYGLGEFLSTNYKISDGYTTFQRPHNDILWVWSETGMMGLLAYIFLLTYPIFCSIQYALSKRNEPIAALRAMIPAFFLISYLVVAFTDFPLERNEHQLVLALLISWILGTQTNPAKLKIVSVIPLGMAFMLLLFSSLVVWKRLPNEQHAKRMEMAHGNANWYKLVKEAARIDSNWYTIDNFSIPIAWYQGVASFSLGNKVQASHYFEAAYQINPYQIHVLNNLASISEMNENHTKALFYYNQLLQISPSQPDALLNKSAVLFNIGNFQEAMETLYQFKYDETNTQFLNYLQAIGKSYLLQRIENKSMEPLYLAEELDRDPLILKNIFRINQKNNTTFGQVDFTLK